MSDETEPNKAQEVSKQAFEQAKAATSNARGTLATLFGDPLGGQEKAIAALGPTGALQSGIVFVAAFVLASLLAGILCANALGPFAGGGVGGSIIWRTFLSALLSVAGLFAAIWLAAKFFGKNPLNSITVLFTTGVCLIPVTVGILLSIILVKLQLVTLGLIAMVFALTLLVLLVNASLVRVAGMNDRVAFFMTPTVLVVATALVRLLT